MFFLSTFIRHTVLLVFYSTLVPGKQPGTWLNPNVLLHSQKTLLQMQECPTLFIILFRIFTYHFFKHSLLPKAVTFCSLWTDGSCSPHSNILAVCRWRLDFWLHSLTPRGVVEAWNWCLWEVTGKDIFWHRWFQSQNWIWVQFSRSKFRSAGKLLTKWPRPEQVPIPRLMEQRFHHQGLPDCRVPGRGQG